MPGDYVRLARLGANLRWLAAGGMNRQTRRAFGGIALSEIARSFAQGCDPYGKAWKARKNPRARGKILWGRGVLPRSFYVTTQGHRVVIRSRVSFASAHEYGVPSRGLPARPMLPTRGLPPHWAERLKRELGAALRHRF